MIIECDRCKKTERVPMQYCGFNMPDGWHITTHDTILSRELVYVLYCPDCREHLKNQTVKE